MPILGIAPRLLPYESNVLTVILYRQMLPLGIEPRFFGYQPNVLPLYYGGYGDCRIRTCEAYALDLKASPFDRSGKSPENSK